MGKKPQMRLPRKIEYLLLNWTAFAFLFSLSADAQLTWTPIYNNGKNQVDLWTQESKGCMCPWDRSNNQCACCVTDGGCHCGRDAPNRCSQCGLEQHCNHMCNITVMSAELQAKSGKTFGQIKSPSLEGPDSCWYIFTPAPFQRVEIQIYRLVNVGKFNGTSCIGGSLKFSSASETQYNTNDNQICGMNERYTPPVVFFSDNGVSTLLFQITEKTSRSQFLAYFSFTSIDNPDLGYQPRGGLKLQNTDCDWLYRDFACNKSDSKTTGDPGYCVLASPNYPGLYPPQRQCKYHITTQNENTHVRITFLGLLLPQDHCQTDYVAIYQGSTTTSPLLAKLCGNQRKIFEYSGLNLLVEFSSGPQVPPYDYNGFLAALKFYEKTTTTEIPVTQPAPTTERVSSNKIVNSTTTPTQDVDSNIHDNSNCDILISGNNTRSGHFDTREHEWFPICRLIFKGRPTDVVYITFFNYRLRNALCKSIIEIIDGSPEERKNPLEKICSPKINKEEETRGHVKRKSFLSSGNSMIVLFRRPTAPLSTNEAEFLTGAYFFHDEQISGTMQPTGLCDVKYNGINSPIAGMIDSPGFQNTIWASEGPLSCHQEFIPAANQSITIKVQKLEGMSLEPSCVTQCGDNGCRCVSSSPLKNVDYLLLKSGDDSTIACLCGAFQKEWLPVSVRTWGALSIVYSVAQYAWNKGFGFSASYAFTTDNICGDHIYTLHYGEITMKNLTSQDYLNHFYQQSCTWTLHSNVERQLELDMTSTQNRPCTAWNISIHEYTPNPKKQNLGELIHTFCSRDNHKQYYLPWKLNTIVIRLHTLSRILPQFKIKWKSQVVRANTRFGAPTPSPNAVSSTNILKPFYPAIFLLTTLNRLKFHNTNVVLIR